MTPPLKNVRRRRFRKTLVKKTFDVEDIERELARLFAADSEAVDVRWEVVEEEEKQEKPVRREAANVTTEEADDEAASPTAVNQPLLSARNLFGDDLSSSDEEEDDDEDDERQMQVPEDFDEQSRDGLAMPRSVNPATPGSNSAFPSSPGDSHL